MAYEASVLFSWYAYLSFHAVNEHRPEAGVFYSELFFVCSKAKLVIKYFLISYCFE